MDERNDIKVEGKLNPEDKQATLDGLLSYHASQGYPRKSIYIIILVVLVVISAAVGGFFLGQKQNVNTNTYQISQKPNTNNESSIEIPNNPQYWESNAYISTNKKIVSKCQTEFDVSKDEYLHSYTVKKGDSLLSISKNELGTPARVQELITLNSGVYPHFINDNKTNNNFLEIGWIIYLPPKDINTSGFLYYWKGEFIAETDQALTFQTGNTRVGQLIHVFDKTQDTKTLGKSIFHKGDCANVLVDANDKYRAKVITTQEKNWLKN